MDSFGKTERSIKDLFSKSSSFNYKNVNHTVITCGKPKPLNGECKTDVYVLAQECNGNKREFKISVKQANADFLENKISLERAIDILGEEAQSIIANSIHKIKKAFEDDYLVYFNSYKRTEALCLKMGWKFEFINKLGGEKSGIINLTDQQKIDIYAGTNLKSEKKDCFVNGVLIKDSGIANYIINIDNPNETLDYYLERMIPIEDFAKKQKIFFACKALNYRCSKDKWDGNRPLAVYVNWTLHNNKLKGELVYESPLSIRGDIVGENIKNLLSKLNINKENFEKLKDYLDKDVKYI